MTRIATVAALAALLVPAGAAGAAEPRACAVTGLEGNRIEIAAAGGWLPLAGAELPEGPTRLRTGAGTRAEIRCADGLAVTLGPETEIDLSGLVGDPGRPVLLRLAAGIVGLVAPVAPAGGLAVETPLAIASVRSTEWLVEAGELGATAVFVRAGRVAVTPPGGAETWLLGPGEGIDLAPPPAPPTRGPGAVAAPADAEASVRRWPAERIAAAGARLGFGWR